MLTMMMLILFFAIFGKLLVFSLKVGWGIFKIVAYLVLLPAIVLMFIFGGLAFVALPILLVVGIVSMAARA